jgi:hypothetical protein
MVKTPSNATSDSARRELRGSVKRVRRGAACQQAVDRSTPISVSVYLRRPPEAPPLKDMAYFVANPPGARELISREELKRRYAAKPEDVQGITEFAAAHGLTVGEIAPERRLVHLSGTAGKMEEAFGVKLNQYRTESETYRSHEGPVTLPPEIADAVVGVFGLDNRRMARRGSTAMVQTRARAHPKLAPRETVRPTDGIGDGFGGIGNTTPPQVAAAYNFPNPSGGAAGQTVAVLEFSGPTTATPPTAAPTPTCGFGQSDINSFITYVNSVDGSSLSSIAVTPVPLGGATDTESGSATNVNLQTNDDIEVALDLQVIVSVAQGAKVVAYFTPMTEQGWVDAINAIVADTANNPDVLSISWGWAELEADQVLDDPSFPPVPWPFEWTESAYDQLTTAFQSAANIGMTVLVSAGDNGSDCGEDDGKAHVLYPAADPWVTACGGTIINSLSPLSEGTWNDYGATGGGVSYLVGTQPWQADANVPVSANGDGHTGRGVPDVAGNASPLSGYLLYLYGTRTDSLLVTAPPFEAGGPLGAIGGTSAVAPLYASLVARINAILDTRVGYLNPTLYGLGGTGVFRDIADGVSNSVSTASGGTSPGYTAVKGWDACTGWGGIDGQALLNALRPLFQRQTTLILDRTTFGLEEVKAQGLTATFPDVVYVVADGFIPSQLGLNAGNLNVAPPSTVLQFGGSFAGLSSQGVNIVFDSSTGAQLASPGDFSTPQRITFPYNVVFSSTNAFGPIANSPGYQDFTLFASVTTIASGGVASVAATSSTAEIELVLQADPYMTAGETWWLSDDMRVFTVTPATLHGSPPLQDSNTTWTGDPNSYIAALLTELNTDFTDPAMTNTPFTGISAGEDQSALQLNTKDNDGNPVFNFAVARVHLAAGTANDVRVFFRLFISNSPDTDFDTSTTFREAPQTDSSGNPIANTLIPLIGFPSSDMTSTIPFFAAPRIDATTFATTYQSDGPNVQTMPSPLAPSPAPGTAVVSYFGCWLDINQSTPQFPLNPASEPKPNGPWPMSDLLSINQIIMSNHACLVAEINYTPNPIPPGANAAASDKIQQRNLNWVPSDNPGTLAGHSIPALFDLRPSTTLEPSRLYPPDELMIEWGNTPAGALASIYLPGVAAQKIVDLADELYFTHTLTASQSYTISCRTGGVTYVPIPPGTGGNFAGLLTVDLPAGIRAGQQFEIVVRRLASARQSPVINAREAERPNWRYVVGAFQINVPVRHAPALLADEENLLAVFKWKLDELPAGNRWYPVLKRYVAQIAGRVDAYGGTATKIPPSPLGYSGPTSGIGPGNGPGVLPLGDVASCGKVTGLVFGRFGDFEGFSLETEAGEERRFHCEEDAIKDLVRSAFLERWVIEVLARQYTPHIPVSIIVRRAPRPH